ncbi:hypothetical protein SLE2022_016820 [Rubroshorea leprosula]
MLKDKTNHQMEAGPPDQTLRCSPATQKASSDPIDPSPSPNSLRSFFPPSSAPPRRRGVRFRGSSMWPLNPRPPLPCY